MRGYLTINRKIKKIKNIGGMGGGVATGLGGGVPPPPKPRPARVPRLEKIEDRTVRISPALDSPLY